MCGGGRTRIWLLSATPRLCLCLYERGKWKGGCQARVVHNWSEEREAVGVGSIEWAGGGGVGTGAGNMCIITVVLSGAALPLLSLILRQCSTIIPVSCLN